jgi:hypothetical protein
MGISLGNRIREGDWEKFVKGIWGQATVIRYFLFLPSINFSLMRFNALANDLTLCSRSSTFMIASPMAAGLRRK